MAKSRKRTPHPMIAAVINELPVQGPWSAGNRAAWLRMMATAFDVAYGPAGAAMTPEDLGQAGEPAKVARANPPRFFIDKLGFARKDPGGIRIMPGNIDAGEVLYDDRGEHGDLSAITWSDDSTGVLGLQLEISAVPDRKAV